MSFMRQDPVCPRCYQVLIELHKFDARDDSMGVDTGGWGPNKYGNRQIGQGMAALGIIESLMDMFGGRLKQRQLDRVVKEYPNSLYCSSCGYIERRA